MRNASIAWNELLHSAMNVRNQSALFPGHSGTLPPIAEIRAVRPNDEHPAVTQARVMDRCAKVHGKLAADAVRRGVRQDNGPDAVILLKPDRRHFSHSSVRSGVRLAIGENGHLLSESGGHRLRSEAEDRATYCSSQGTT